MSPGWSPQLSLPQPLQSGRGQRAWSESPPPPSGGWHAILGSRVGLPGAGRAPPLLCTLGPVAPSRWEVGQERREELRSRAPGWPCTTPSLRGPTPPILGSSLPSSKPPVRLLPWVRAVLWATGSSPDLGTPLRQSVIPRTSICEKRGRAGWLCRVPGGNIWAARLQVTLRMWTL